MRDQAVPTAASATPADAPEQAAVGKRSLDGGEAAGGDDTAPAWEAIGSDSSGGDEPRPEDDGTDNANVAERAFTGGGAALPHLARIQHAFGHHDVSTVQAFVGPKASAAANSVSAEAFTNNGRIAFRDPSPDLHLVAHEATHALQQRAGLAKPGVDTDAQQEADADRVADEVVAGRSAASLLDRMLGAARGAPVDKLPTTGAVQRKKAKKTDKDWERAFFNQKTESIHALALVSAEAGIRPYKKPSSVSDKYDDKHLKAPKSKTIPRGTPVMVLRRTTQEDTAKVWCFISCPKGSGFIQEQFLTLNPPTANTGVHIIRGDVKNKDGDIVRPGETLGGIVERTYGKHIKGGNDERLYVQALVYANKDNSSIFVDKVHLSWSESAWRGEAEERTVEIYKGAKCVAGQPLLLPPNDFIQKLKHEKKITSGETAFSKAWRETKDAFHDIVDALKEIAGIAVGLVEGAGLAVYDLFKGAADTIKLVLQAISGNLGPLIDLAKHWIYSITHAGSLARDFLAKWNDHDAWDRGKFRGKVIGWGVTTVLLTLLTGPESGIAAIERIATRFPVVVGILKTAGAAGSLKTYFGPMLKSGRKALGKHLPTVKKTLGTKIKHEKAKLASEAAERALRKAGKKIPLEKWGGELEDFKKDHETSWALVNVGKSVSQGLKEKGAEQKTGALVSKKKKKIQVTHAGKHRLHQIFTPVLASFLPQLPLMIRNAENDKQRRAFIREQKRLHALDAFLNGGRSMHVVGFEHNHVMI